MHEEGQRESLGVHQESDSGVVGSVFRFLGVRMDIGCSPYSL